MSSYKKDFHNTIIYSRNRGNISSQALSQSVERSAALTPAQIKKIKEIMATLPPEKAAALQKKLDALEYREPQTVTLPPKINNSPLDITLKPTGSGLDQTLFRAVGDIMKVPYFSGMGLSPVSVIFDADLVSPRGYMLDKRITMSPSIGSYSEMTKVFVHELSHILDIYIFANNQLSKPFYELSWSEPTVLRSESTSADFISGYAATNQYEDFSESFTAYVFHSRAFSKRAKNSPVLKKKYLFFANTIFKKNFISTHLEVSPLPKDIWDITKIEVNGFSQ